MGPSVARSLLKSSYKARFYVVVFCEGYAVNVLILESVNMFGYMAKGIKVANMLALK